MCFFPLVEVLPKIEECFLPLVGALPDRGVRLAASGSDARDRGVLFAAIVGVLPKKG